MKKVKAIVAVFAAGLMLSACSLITPVCATSNSVGSKVGTAKATGYLGVLFFNQDASIQKAAKSAGITSISTVDIKSTSILGIVVTKEAIVTGN